MASPIPYSYENAWGSASVPSTVHVKNTVLSAYFRRHLMQRAISLIEFDNLPEMWDKNYLLYCVFGLGYVAVVNTDKFGIIPQNCTLSGFNVFYRPTHAQIVNPALSGITTAEIGKTTELILLQPDYGSVSDIVGYYSDLLALCVESISTSLVNSKLAFVFFGDSNGDVKTLQALYDNISKGQPAVFTDKNAKRPDGSSKWEMFSQNVGQNFIADKVLMCMRKIESMFDTEIGIPNSNTDKKERQLVDEVNSNNIETASKLYLWFDTLKESIEKVNKMFNLNISVKLRFDPLEEQEVKDNENDTVNVGAE